MVMAPILLSFHSLDLSPGTCYIPGDSMMCLQQLMWKKVADSALDVFVLVINMPMLPMTAPGGTIYYQKILGS